MLVSIEEFPGYSVDELGQVWSDRTRRFLRPRRGPHGTIAYRLYQEDLSTKTVLAHRLVAEYFVDRPEGTFYVRHLDGDKTNNVATNLAWIIPEVTKAAIAPDDSVWHGTAGGYTNHKCRCEPCRTAWNKKSVLYKKKRQEKFLSDEVRRKDLLHGDTSTYYKGCRCEECRKAVAAADVPRGLVSKGEYQDILRQQNFACALCKRPPRTGTKLVIDHDHATLKFRGLLCHSCNTGLGKLGDNLEGLRRAIEYLEGK